MSPALAGDILNYAYESDKPLYRATLSSVAESRKLRPIFLERQPRSQRHGTMLAALTRPAMELVAGNLIRTWLVKKQNAVLVEFLNALGIAHKDGVVDDLPPSMDDAKLHPAIEALLSHHPHEVVAVYLLAFNEMNEANWPNLKALLESDRRLELGAKS